MSSKPIPPDTKARMDMLSDLHKRSQASGSDSDSEQDDRQDKAKQKK